MLDQQRDDAVEALVGDVVERGAAGLVDGVDVAARRQGHPHRGERPFLVGVLGLEGEVPVERPVAPVPHSVAPARAGRQHQRGPAVPQRQHAVGAGGEQRAHDVLLGELGGQGEGRRPEQMVADHQHLPVAGHARRLGHLRVRPRAGGEQRFDHAEVALQHRRVQRRVAGRRRVRVGALGQQEPDERPVAAVRRHDERAPAVRRGVVDVGPGVQQQPRRGDAAVPRREQQRRVAAQIRLFRVGAVAPAQLAVAQVRLQPPADDETPDAGPPAHVGAAVQQHPHHRRVALRHRPHQRRLILLGFGGVHVRAVVEKRGDRGRGAGAGAAHQHRLAGGDGRPRVGARRQQQIDQRRVRVRAGERQRHDAVRVRGPGVGAGGEQQARRLQVVEIRRPVQRRRAVRLRGVDVGGRIEKAAHRRRVLQLDGFDQPQVGALRVRPDRSEHEDADPDRQQRRHAARQSPVITQSHHLSPLFSPAGPAPKQRIDLRPGPAPPASRA